MERSQKQAAAVMASVLCQVMHHRQQGLTDATASNLVVEGNLLLSLVKHWTAMVSPAYECCGSKEQGSIKSQRHNRYVWEI